LRNNFQSGDYYIWLYTANGVPSSYERYEVTNVTLVGEKNDDVLVDIEMATHFPDNYCDDDNTHTGANNDNAGASYNDIGCEAYDVHHRMQVSLSDNLAATDSKHDWKLARFDYKKLHDGDADDDSAHDVLKQSSWEWQSATPTGEMGGDNVQAFEEKFDCFLALRGYDNMIKGDDIMESQQHCFGTRKGDERGKCYINGEHNMDMVRTQRHGYTGSWYGAESAGRLCGVALFKEFDPTFSFSLIEYGNNMRGIRSSVRVAR